MLSINFNPSLLKAQNVLNIANTSLNKSLERMTTGVRINSASDDASGYYISSGLNSQIRGLKVAQSNVAMGSSMLGVAEGALDSMTTMLNRLNDLALQGASTAMTSSTRNALTKEAAALVEEIKKLNNNTAFNGINLFGNISSPVEETKTVSSETVPTGYTAIRTVDDLKNVNNNLSGKYILMNDIDLSSEDNWIPISSFKGTFDGNGHVIKNLKINLPDIDEVGLFASTTVANIKNLGLENVNVTGGDYNVGGLVGFASGGSIENCYATGIITGKTSAGGLVGYMDSTTITGCYASCNVTGERLVGGLLGAGSHEAISNCYSTGNIKGIVNVGGLIGGSWDDNVSNCYSTGNVEGNDKVGGLIGDSQSDNFSNCYTTCSVKCISKTGQIIGYLYNSNCNNIWAMDNGSGLAAIGDKLGTNTITNTDVVSKMEFTTHEFWDKNFDQTDWEMSFSIPPILKGVGGQNNNWYFGRGTKESRLQVGTDADPASNAMFMDTGLNLGGLKIDLSTVEGCLDASDCAQAALNAIAQKTADIGIFQSKLDTISNVNTIKLENLTAAYSTINDTDVAQEAAEYTKAQIMAQTASTLTTQTRNFQSNLVLRMISGFS